MVYRLLLASVVLASVPRPLTLLAHDKKELIETLSSAKTLYMDVRGKAVLKAEISKKIQKWGRLKIVSSIEEADLIMYVEQAGDFNFGGGSAQAAAILKDRHDKELWYETKGGTWAWSGFDIANVGRQLGNAFTKFFDKTVRVRRK